MAKARLRTAEDQLDKAMQQMNREMEDAFRPMRLDFLSSGPSKRHSGLGMASELGRPLQSEPRAASPLEKRWKDVQMLTSKRRSTSFSAPKSGISLLPTRFPRCTGLL